MNRSTGFKILLTALLILLLLPGMLGCATMEKLQACSSCSEVADACSTDIFGEPEQEYTEISISLPRHSGYAPIADKSAYASLKTADQREAYLSIEQSLFRVTGESGGSNGLFALCRAMIPSLTSGEIFMVKEAVLADHPEAFWVNGRYTIGYNFANGDYITMYSTVPAAEIPDRAKAIAKRTAELLKEIPSELNEYDRELIIHDCLIRDVEYDLDAAADSSHDSEAATVYGALVGRKAVCSGYARTAKLLLNRVGIQSSTVKGVSKDVGHMWNVAFIDGDWYHLDVTWDDPVAYSSEAITGYGYFNLTDEQISADHDIAGGYELLTEEVIQNQDESSLNFYNFELPECVSESANFYRRNAVSIDKLNAENATRLESLVRAGCQSGEPMLYISFDADMTGEVIGEWLDQSLKSAMAAVNKEAAAGRLARAVSRCVRGEGSPDSWCNVYIIKLYFNE